MAQLALVFLFFLVAAIITPDTSNVPCSGLGRRFSWIGVKAASHNDARFLSSVQNTSTGTLRVNYQSNIFKGEITIIVSNTSVIFQAPAPLGLRKSDAEFLPGPLYENYALPSGSAPYTLIDHISIFYDSFGALPYPKGQSDPTPKSSSSRSLNVTCLTCYFYITFFFIPITQAKAIGADCATNPNFFCNITDGPFILRPPSSIYVPPSFTTTAGDFYNGLIQSSTKGVSTLKPAFSLEPLAAAQVGLFWVSNEKPPQPYVYNGETVLGAENFYVSDNATIVGVGQVVSTTYFNFFANYFITHPDEIHSEDTSGAFDKPTNFTYNGKFPTKAITIVDGYRGQITMFSFGFTDHVQVVSDIRKEATFSAPSWLSVLFGVILVMAVQVL